MLEPEHIAWGREFARRRENARRAAWEKQARRASGVCWSGAAPAPFDPASDEALEQEAIRWAEIRRARLGRSADALGVAP
ncbi:MAG: hypothetical protein WCY15_06290 [Phenylobacterium sp.]|jgi:hypothetical protein|uniref:hypothetical protein n=1 Tax=Phenylobacterium sp. TaxID=1871053 RepID=UPI002A3656FF|nr:hypothetical protein [Phenylobacterium sp.]MDX9997854.1 hypothetical protein [Phenylobacterium sp.]